MIDPEKEIRNIMLTILAVGTGKAVLLLILIFYLQKILEKI